MEEGTIGRRYARALAETLEESEVSVKEISEVEEELSQLRGLMRDKAGMFRKVMTDPSFTADQRLSVVTEIASKHGFKAHSKNFLMLLVKRDRMRFIADISSAFADEVDERTNRVRALLTSAKEISKDYKSDIVAALEKRTGKKVVAETKVDPSLISGVRAQIGGMVIDGTVRAQLDRLRGSLGG